MKRERRNILFIVLSIFFVVLGSVSASADDGQYADVQGRRVFYRDLGTGGPVVVMVHGWSCDQTFWRLQAPALSARTRVILVDLIGHGRSDKPQVPYTQDFMAESLNAVMTRAGVTKAVLVGHSMGASVVRRFALAHPDKVAGIVIVDGVVEDVPEDPAGREKWKTGFDTFVASLQGPDAEVKTREFIEAMFSPATTPDVRREILGVMMAAPAHVARSAMSLMGDPAIWTVQPIPAPTLAIYAKSPWLAPDFEKVLKRHYPQVEYRVWEGVGHFYMFERPDDLNQALIGFLDRLK